MKVGYVRVSTVEQNEERQIKALEEIGCSKIFVDKCSGKNTDRPKFKEMMNFVREGDTLYVSEFSRLARSTKDLLNIIDELKAKNVHVISQKENFDTSTPQGKFMLTVFAGIAEFERTLMLQRQAEGIAIAKAQGKYKGRLKKKRPADYEYYKNQYYHREISATLFAKRCFVSRTTLYSWLREDKEKHLKDNM